jgi:hypothetical protein
MKLYVLQENKPTGPFDEAEIISRWKTATVSDTDLVWTEGLNKWTPLAKLLSVSNSTAVLRVNRIPRWRLRTAVVASWLLLAALLGLAIRADSHRFESAISFQSALPIVLWQNQKSFVSLQLRTPGTIERIEFIPATKPYLGRDCPLGKLGSSPGRSDGKATELIDANRIVRFYAEVNHPEPPSNAVIVIWYSDQSGEKFPVTVKRRYFQLITSWIDSYLEASKETEKFLQQQKEQQKEQQR